MNPRNAFVICALISLIMLPTAGAQGGGPAFTIEGLTLSTPGDVSVRQGLSTSAVIEVSYDGAEALDVTLTARAGLAMQGNFTGRPGMPPGNFTGNPPAGGPGGNGTRPPGNFTGGPPPGNRTGGPGITVQGLSLQVDPQSGRLEPGIRTQASILITASSPPGDYRITVMFDAGASGRAITAFTIHVLPPETPATSDAQGAPSGAIGVCVIGILAAAARRRLA